jgi:hypothetical protein
MRETRGNTTKRGKNICITIDRPCTATIRVTYACMHQKLRMRTWCLSVKRLPPSQPNRFSAPLSHHCIAFYQPITGLFHCIRATPGRAAHILEQAVAKAKTRVSTCNCVRSTLERRLPEQRPEVQHHKRSDKHEKHLHHNHGAMHSNLYFKCAMKTPRYTVFVGVVG